MLSKIIPEEGIIKYIDDYTKDRSGEEIFNSMINDIKVFELNSKILQTTTHYLLNTFTYTLIIEDKKLIATKILLSDINVNKEYTKQDSLEELIINWSSVINGEVDLNNNEDKLIGRIYNYIEDLFNIEYNLTEQERCNILDHVIDLYNN